MKKLLIPELKQEKHKGLEVSLEENSLKCTINYQRMNQQNNKVATIGEYWISDVGKKATHILKEHCF